MAQFSLIEQIKKGLGLTGENNDKPTYADTNVLHDKSEFEQILRGNVEQVLLEKLNTNKAGTTEVTFNLSKGNLEMPQYDLGKHIEMILNKIQNDVDSKMQKGMLNQFSDLYNLTLRKNKSSTSNEEKGKSIFKEVDEGRVIRRSLVVQSIKNETEQIKTNKQSNVVDQNRLSKYLATIHQNLLVKSDPLKNNDDSKSIKQLELNIKKMILNIKDNLGKLQMKPQYDLGKYIEIIVNKVQNDVDSKEQEGILNQFSDLYNLALRKNRSSTNNEEKDISIFKEGDEKRVRRKSLVVQSIKNETEQIETNKHSNIVDQNKSSNYLATTQRKGDSKSLKQLELNIKKIIRNINKLELSSNHLDKLAKLVKKIKYDDETFHRLTVDIQENNREIRSIDNSLVLLAHSVTDIGFSAKWLRNQLEALNLEFKEGALSIDRYENKLSHFTNQTNASTMSLSRLRKEIILLNELYEKENKNLLKDSADLTHLDSNLQFLLTETTGGNSNNNPATQNNKGLLETLKTRVMEKASDALIETVIGAMDDVTGGRSILKKGRNGSNRRDVIRNARTRQGEVLLDREGKVIYMEDVLEEDSRQRSRSNRNEIIGKRSNKKSKTRNVFGMIPSGSKLLKSGSSLLKGSLWTAAIAEVAVKGYDLASSAFQEDFEKQKIQADKLDDLSKQYKNLRYGNPFEKAIAGTSILGDAIFGSINNMLGGNEASIAEVYGGFKDVLNASSEEDLEKLLNKRYDTLGMRKEAKKLEDEYAANHDPNFNSSKGKPSLLVKQEKQSNYETVPSNLFTAMSRELSLNQSNYNIESTKLLLTGVRSDSDQIRQLMRELFIKNSSILERTLEKLRERMVETPDKNSEAYKDMKVQERNLEAQLMITKDKIKKNEMNQYDSIMNMLLESLSVNENEYSIQESHAKLSGATEDSPLLNKIELEKVKSANSKIEQAQTDLGNLARQLNLQETDVDYIKIQNTIKDLEEQQLNNLVAIKSNLTKQQSTFNLPSGVRVMSYTEHMMGKNTQRNVTTRMGDSIININIDKMNGSQEDIEKIRDSLTNAIKDTNQKMINEFNRQVWSGLGAGYSSPY
ncbi:hypothetical protein ACSVDA_11995 [Cytobacillus sp. Hm23]